MFANGGRNTEKKQEINGRSKTFRFSSDLKITGQSETMYYHQIGLFFPIGANRR